jgi:hypothetical protein
MLVPQSGMPDRTRRRGSKSALEASYSVQAILELAGVQREPEQIVDQHELRVRLLLEDTTKRRQRSKDIVA